MAKKKPQLTFETVHGGVLTEDDVTEYLQSLFVVLFDLATDIDTEPWSKRRFNDLADRLFDYAVYLLLSEPPEGDVPLGSWSVPAEYRTAFIERISGLIAPTLLQLAELQPYLTQWAEPTPQMIVEEFMIEMGWGRKTFKMLREWFTFAGKLADKVTGARLDTHPELSAEHQFLTRHIFRIRFKSVVTDHHVNLASFIRSRSKKYADVEPIQLTWRAQ